MIKLTQSFSHNIDEWQSVFLRRQTGERKATIPIFAVAKRSMKFAQSIIIDAYKPEETVLSIIQIGSHYNEPRDGHLMQ